MMMAQIILLPWTSPRAHSTLVLHTSNDVVFALVSLVIRVPVATFHIRWCQELQVVERCFDTWLSFFVSTDPKSLLNRINQLFMLFMQQCTHTPTPEDSTTLSLKRAVASLTDTRERTTLSLLSSSSLDYRHILESLSRVYCTIQDNIPGRQRT